MRIRSLATSLMCVSLQMANADLTLAGEIDAHGLFRQLDANADGQFSRAEAGAEHRLLFSRLVRTGDSNHDGRLTAGEFATALIPVRAEKADIEKQPARLPGTDALVVMMARMDADGDSQLEAAEIPERYKPLYERMLARGDDNKDERLDARELARGGPRLGIIAQLEAARLGIDVAAALEKMPHDRRTSIEEMDAYPRADMLMADPAQAGKFFNQLDSNGDKLLAANEVSGPLAERFAGMLSRGDRDGDEQLSKREFLALARRFAAYQQADPNAPQAQRIARQLLQRFDQDGDQRLSRQEAPRRLARAFDRVDSNGDDQLDGAELAVMASRFERTQQMAADNRAGDPALDPPRKPAKQSAKKAARDAK